jgi:HTH-type transcriptional regulator / antitoxin HigA
MENQYFPQSRPHPGETLKEKLDEMGMPPKKYIASKPGKRKIGILDGKGKVDFKDNFSMNEEDFS